MENELKQITRKLQYYRKKSKVSQLSIAQELNVSKQTISLFENGGLNNMKLFIYYVTRFIPYEDSSQFIDDCGTLLDENTERGGSISWRF